MIERMTISAQVTDRGIPNTRIRLTHHGVEIDDLRHLRLAIANRVAIGLGRRDDEIPDQVLAARKVMGNLAGSGLCALAEQGREASGEAADYRTGKRRSRRY
jgi:hypothetical protein